MCVCIFFLFLFFIQKKAPKNNKISKNKNIRKKNIYNKYKECEYYYFNYTHTHKHICMHEEVN